MSNAAATTAPLPQASVLAWWTDLQDDPGARAELRRAHGLEEIVLTPAFNHLRIRLQGSDWQDYARLALVAGVLAQVEKNLTDTPRDGLGALLAAPRKSGQGGARLSGLRFRRLIQNKTPAELLHPMIRVIRLLDRTAPVQTLAENLYWWSERNRRELAFAYYKSAPDER